MKKILKLIIWMWKQAWSSAPQQTLALITVNLVLAAVPALQVSILSQYIQNLTVASQFSDASHSFISLVLLIAFSSPLGSVEQVLQMRTIDLIKLTLSKSVAQTIAGLNPQELASPEVAETIEKANVAAQDELPARFGYTVTLIRDVIAVTAVIATLASMSTMAALLALLSLFPILIAAHRSTSINVKLWDSIGQRYWRARYLHQNLVSSSTSRELNALGAASKVESLVSEEYFSIAQSRKKTYGPILALRLTTALISSVILAFALAALNSSLHYGPVAAGGVYGVMAAMSTVATLGANLGAVVESVSSYGRFRKLEELRRPPVSHSYIPAVDQIRVNDVSFKYPGRREFSLSKFSLSANAGQMIALVGVNGAGKTTAVHCILGALSTSGGSIRIDGLNYEDSSPSEWGSFFGVLTQDFGKYELTVRQTLNLGLREGDVTDEQCWSALRAADAEQMVRGFPEGLDQQLGSQWPGGINISGGQWQRISLARIILRDAPIWILDEPTSAVDAEAEQEIFRVLKRNRGNRIIIIVSHRAWTLKNMDEIIVLESGEIIERGTYQELLSSKSRFAEMFAEQILS